MCLLYSWGSLFGILISVLLAKVLLPSLKTELALRTVGMFFGGCSKGPCKEGTIGNTLPYMGILTKTGNLYYGHFGNGYFEQLPFCSEFGEVRA